MKDRNQERAMQHNGLREAIEAGRWGNLPTMAELDQWHIDSLIEEQADIAKDLGMYKRILENPNLRADNRALVKSLQKLDERRYWLLDNEIERLRSEQERPRRIRRAG